MITIATNNAGKLSEYRALLKNFFPKATVAPNEQVQSLNQAGIFSEPDESGTTLTENALIKARAAFAITGTPVLADDSGLFVRALGDAPGVYSSRYAATDELRVKRLLEEMREATVAFETTDRYAEFRAVICYIDETGAEHCFEGKVSGEIGETPKGHDGFGYDPVFFVNGLSFAQIPQSEKNKISHRARALTAFAEFLKSKTE